MSLCWHFMVSASMLDQVDCKDCEPTDTYTGCREEVEPASIKGSDCHVVVFVSSGHCVLHHDLSLGTCHFNHNLHNTNSKKLNSFLQINSSQERSEFICKNPALQLNEPRKAQCSGRGVGHCNRASGREMERVATTTYETVLQPRVCGHRVAAFYVVTACWHD